MLRMMLSIHNSNRHQRLELPRADREIFTRRKRSMLMLCGLRYSPGVAGALVPAVTAATTSLTAWGRTHSKVISQHCQQQQSPAPQCCSNSNGISSSSSDSRQTQGSVEQGLSRSSSTSGSSSTPATAAQLQLLQLACSPVASGQLLPYTARMPAVAAAAAALAAANPAAAAVGSSRRHKQADTATAAIATAVLQQTAPEVDTSSARRQTTSNRRSRAMGLTPAGRPEDAQAPPAAAAAAAAAAQSSTQQAGSKRRSCKRPAEQSPAAAAAAAAAEPRSLQQPAATAAGSEAAQSSKRSRRTRPAAAAAEGESQRGVAESAAAVAPAASRRRSSRSRSRGAAPAAAAEAAAEEPSLAEAAAAGAEPAARRRSSRSRPRPAAAAAPPPAAAAEEAPAGSRPGRSRRRPRAAVAAVEPPAAPPAAAPVERRVSRRARPAAAAAVLEQQQQARELLALLNDWSDAYYNGAAIVTDDEYDSQLERFKGLLRQLRAAGAEAEAQQLELNSPVKRVGAPVPAVSQLRKVKHPTPMTSLASMRDKNEIIAWAGRLGRSGVVDPEAVNWVVEPKVDGLACRVVYRDGKLSLAATRGDGNEGEDITHNILTGACQGLPVMLAAKPQSGFSVPPEVEIRGEIYMKTADFEALNEEEQQAGRDGFANPRNVASGSARLLDPQEFARRRLSFMAYQLLLPEGTTNAPTTQSGSLDWMKAVGISTTTSSTGGQQGRKAADETATYGGFTAAMAAAETWMERRAGLDYEVDGAVLKIDDVSIQQALGIDGARDPKWAVAWKFPAQEVTTKLLGIEWNVGRHGAVTPVALLEPVECGGVTVSRASVHNLGHLRNLAVRIGDTVTIKRAGDVIPQLVGFLPDARGSYTQAIPIPHRCPSCTGELTERPPVSREAGEQLFCGNTSCPAQHLGKLQRFASVCMKNVGDGIVEQLWSRGLLDSPAGFYKLTKEDVLQLPGTKDRKAKKILDAIEESRNVTLAQLIQGLGIPAVGKQQAENLAKKHKTMKALQLWSSRHNGNGHDGSAASQHTAVTHPSSSSSSSGSAEGGEKGVLGDSLETWFTDAHNKLLLNELRDLGVRVVQEDDQAADTSEIQLESELDPRAAPRIGGLTPGWDDVKPLEGLSICVTGTLTSPRYGASRGAAKAFIEARGGEFHQILKKSTQWFVVASSPGKSKIEKAQKWGTRILTEHELNAEIERRVLQLQGYLDFSPDPPTHVEDRP